MRADWQIADYWPPSVWLTPCLRALTEVNEAYLRANPQAPMLYDSGVRYQLDPSGTELWQDIPNVLARRVGDCKKLCAWRAAELRVRRGIAAVATPVLQKVDGRAGVILVHVIVTLPDGRTEDPSRLLGMVG